MRNMDKLKITLFSIAGASFIGAAAIGGSGLKAATGIGCLGIAALINRSARGQDA